MADSFRSRGYDVMTASSGDEASRISLDNDFDLVISDVRMEKGDGLELAEILLKRDPQYPPVVFVTGYLDTQANVPSNVKKIFKKPMRFNEIASFADELFKEAA